MADTTESSLAGTSASALAVAGTSASSPAVEDTTEKRKERILREMIAARYGSSEEEHVKIYLEDMQDYCDVILNDTLLHLSRIFVTNYLDAIHDGQLLAVIRELGYKWSLGTDVIDKIISGVMDDKIKNISVTPPRPTLDDLGHLDLDTVPLPDSEQGAVQLSVAITSEKLTEMGIERVLRSIDGISPGLPLTPVEINMAKALVTIIIGYQEAGGFVRPNPRLAYKLVKDNLEALPMGSNAKTIIEAIEEARNKIPEKKGYEKTKLAIDYIFEMTMIFTEMSREGATDEENQIRFESFLNMYTTYRGMIDAFEQQARARAEAPEPAPAPAPALLDISAENTQAEELQPPVIEEVETLDSQLSDLKTKIYGMMNAGKNEVVVLDALKDGIQLLINHATDEDIEEINAVEDTISEQIREHYEVVD